MHELTVDADGHTAYPVAYALVTALVPEADPELVAAHDAEIRAIAPDLGIPVRRQSVAAQLPKAERILIPSSRHTWRLANGLAEFVRDHLRRAGAMTLVVTNLDRADPADVEFLEVLRRRVDLITVKEAAAEPYPRLSAEEHDARAAALEGPLRPRYGEIAYHRERGAHPDLAFAALWDAMGLCVMAGFHHAAVSFGERALALLPDEDDVETWWKVAYGTAISCAAIDREDTARTLLDEARRRGVNAKARATAAYATAMLLVRHHDAARRDPDEALAWINEAITITDLLPDRRERAFHLSFDLNGAALIQVRRGRPKTAMDLVNQAITLAETDLAEGEHPIHRLVLRVNRATLMAMAGDAEAALPDMDAAIAADPGFPDYYIDRGNLLHKLGRHEEAVRDYESAMRVGLPFPEPYYNRAEVRFALGDLDGALHDLTYTLDLDPGFVDAYVNRSGLWSALGEHEQARTDAQAGLRLDPGNALLFAALGQAETELGNIEAARHAFDRALEIDPTSAATLAGRSTLAYNTGDLAAAVADLTRAIEFEESATYLFNRAVVLRELGHADRARADLLRAAHLDPEDEDVRRAL